MATFTYRTSRGCDYDNREVVQSVREFVNDRNVDVGKLVEPLVDEGVLTVEQVFETMKTHDDFEILEVEQI